MVNNSYQTSRGVVILFAVLLVSVVLTVSLGLFNISYRQLVLSSLARESEVAMSVADTARNCAMYWNSPERPIHPFGSYAYSISEGVGTWSWVPPDPQADDIIFCAEDRRTVVTLTVSSGGGAWSAKEGSGKTDCNDLGELSGNQQCSPGGLDIYGDYIQAIYRSIRQGGGLVSMIEPSNQLWSAHTLFAASGPIGGMGGTPGASDPSWFTRRFMMELQVGVSGSSRTACADVLVIKSTNANAQQTFIIADGYNLSSGDDRDCIPKDINRAVQRTIWTVING